ncbi:MAG: hypothetical protein M5R36_21380 [Deltaproteobacteria bacterium]|nr:hypothetical protein [Deltaproteobacteria bacterium]
MILSEEWIPNDSFEAMGGMTDFEVYSAHTDHLGTPIAVTLRLRSGQASESGTVVWTHPFGFAQGKRFNPFGNSLSSSTRTPTSTRTTSRSTYASNPTGTRRMS